MKLPDDFDTAAAKVAGSLSTDPIDNAARQVVDNQRTTAKSSIYGALLENPDMAARAQKLGRQTGLPPDLVQRNLPEVERGIYLNDVDKLLQQNPAVAQFLASPQFAAMAHDDVKNMGAVESTLRVFGNLGTAAKSGVASVNAGLMGALQAPVDLLAPLGDPLAGTILPENPLRRVASGLSKLRQSYEADAKYWTPKAGGDIEAGIYSGVSSLTTNLLGLPMLFAGPAGQRAYLTQMTAPVGGRAYGEARDKNISPVQALAFGVSQAAVEYATEKLPVAKLVGDLKVGAPLYRTLANQLATEIPGEQLATIVQDLNEWSLLHPEKPFKDYIAERPSAAVQTLVATLVGVGGQVSAVKGIEAAASAIEKRTATVGQEGAADGIAHAILQSHLKGAQAEVAERDAVALTKLSELTKDSKLAQRDPETFKQFVQSVVEDTPIQDVYVNALVLAQAAQNAGVPVAQMPPSIQAQLEEALAIGGDVRIPMAEFAAHIAPTQYAQGLIPHLKTDPLGMSQAEAQVFMQTQAVELQAQVEKSLEERSADMQFRASIEEVRAEFKQQLDSVNRFTREVNDSYANMLANFYAVTAAKVGMTPKALTERYPLRVQAEGVAGATATFDQTLYRGVGGDSGGGNYFTSDPEFARNFTASGRDGEIKVVDIPDTEIHTPSTLPEATNEQQLDAAIAEAKAAGKKAVRVSEGEGQPTSVFVFDKAAVRSMGRYSGGQYSQDQGRIANRGQIAFGDDITKVPSIITLLKGADLSTFLHESGHFFLEVQFDLASRIIDTSEPGAKQILADTNALLDWFGVSNLNEWFNLPMEQKRGYHEQFARGFEAYLFEGKAPSIELQGLFQRFRAWLVRVYKDMKALNVELTDEVRSVMDRMLATTEQIQLAEQGRSMMPLLTSPDQAGMTAEEFAGYQELGTQATQDAVEDLQARTLRDMQWMRNARGREIKRLQKEAAARRAEIKIEARREVLSQPVYRAWQFLTGKLSENDKAAVTTDEDSDIESLGAGRLDLATLKEMGLPEEIIAILQKYKMTGREGIHPDLVAESFGFTSGDELVRTLAATEAPRDAIEGLTEQKLLERYGELATPEAIERAADEAIHNDTRARFVAAGLNALQKATGKPKILASAAREYARQIVDRVLVRNVKPSQYAAAQVRAGKAATAAMKAGDLPKAAAETHNQLINIYAAKSAHVALGDVEKGIRYLKKFESDGVRKNIDVDYLDQIDSILERFDLRVGQSLKSIDKRKALAKWLAEQEELGIEVDLPGKIAAEAFRQSYKDLSVEEFRGLVDSIKQIEHLGRLKEKLLTAQDKRSFEQIVEVIVNSVNDSAGGKRTTNRTRDTLGNRAANLFKGFLASHRKTASLARELDGFKDAGPMWTYLIQSMNKAGDREASMRAEATQRLTELLKPVLAGGRMGGKGQFFPSVAESINRGEQLVMALNMGNAGNMQRLLDGRGWTKEQVLPVLQNLSAADWQFVQSVWDFFESYRPEIAAKERRVLGKEPEWVEPAPLTVATKDGLTVSLKGGYYPIVYDTRESGRAESHADAEAAKQMMKGAFVASTTRRSFTKTRAEEVSGRPLLLTWDALFRGVNDVVHDLSWHEWVIDANRIIRNEKIDKAIRTTHGADVVHQFRAAIRDIAAGDAPNLDALSKVLTPLRTGAAVAGLGFNIMNAMLQPLGITQSMVRVGSRWVVQGVAEWAKSPVGLVQRVHEKSEFMRNRGRTQQRELNEIQSVVQGKGPVRAKLDALMFVPMQSMQLVADMPTWWGAYQKALAEAPTDLAEDAIEERAVRLADQAVIDSQGGGQVKDLALIQRGGPLQKLFTVFYGFFNASYNLGVERAKATNYRSPLAVMHLAWDFLLLYSVPAVLASLLKDALQPGGEDEDEEELARKLIGDQIGYMMGLMVGLREVTGALQYATGTKQFDMAYGGPAGLRFFQELDKLGKQAGQGELDRALARSVVNVGGVMLHLPSGQINRTIDGVIAISEGKTDNPAALAFGVEK